MQINRFLVTSALYLSLAGLGTATAEERLGGKVVVSPATDGRVYSAGNDKLRFSLREQGVLERYSSRPDRADGERKDRDDEGKRHDGDKDGKHKDGHKDGKHKPLPPGLQKKVERGGELPPGWKKKMARGEVLPADVYRLGRPLPPEVRRQLPADPKGTVTLDIDGEVVRVVQDTREVIDILRGR